MDDTPNKCIRDTGSAKGRGVFAMRPFAAGEVVETSPVVLLFGTTSALPAALKSILFDWHKLAGRPNAQAIALGFGSLYNHQNPANMRYAAVPGQDLLQFTAVREILAGEELTINYNALGGGEQSTDNHWFERRGIDLLD